MVNTIGVCIIQQAHLTAPGGSITRTSRLLPFVEILNVIRPHQMEDLRSIRHLCRRTKHELSLVLVQLEELRLLPFVPIRLLDKFTPSELREGIVVHSSTCHNRSLLCGNIIIVDEKSRVQLINVYLWYPIACQSFPYFRVCQQQWAKLSPLRGCHF